MSDMIMASVAAMRAINSSERTQFATTRKAVSNSSVTRRCSSTESDALTSVLFPVDAGVLEFFRDQGAGHFAQMNKILKDYVDAQKGHRLTLR